MAGNKMDWNDFIAQNSEKFGLSPSDWDPLRNSAIVRFDYDDKGNVSGKYRGKTVYRDGYFENAISPGEVWICELNSNPKTGANYFAKPVQRLDASFLYELKKDQAEEIAGILWDAKREVLEPMFEERYREANEARIAKSVEEAKAAFDTERKELQERVAELEAKGQEDERIIASLTENLETLKKAPRPAGPSQAPAKASGIRVRRTGPQTISSDAFTFSRCFVHLSPDHRIMTVRPDDGRGDVLCMDGTITLGGLEIVAPFSKEQDMQVEAKWGSEMMIYLK